MSEIRDYRRSLERSRQSRAAAPQPQVFALAGREWDLLPGVFAPNHSPTTGFSLHLLDLAEDAAPRDGSFLEIGCGTGVIAVCAALAGCVRVVAADVSAQAVDNARRNAVRHGVVGRVRSLHGDLFDPLDPAERFDVVFWHSNYVLAPADYRYASVHEQAYVDPGYAAHRRYLLQAPLRTAPGGQALLHFSARGDLDELRRVAAECDRELHVRRRRVFTEGEHDVEHLLIEIAVPRG